MHPPFAPIAGYIPHDTYHCAVRQTSTEGSSEYTARAESSANRIALNHSLPEVESPARADPSLPLDVIFGGGKLNDIGSHQQKGLPVEIRKPLLRNYLNGCGGQI